MPKFPMVNAGTAAFLQQVHRLPHRKVRQSWNGHIVFGKNEPGAEFDAAARFCWGIGVQR
jgi:hypothetical protein